MAKNPFEPAGEALVDLQFPLQGVDISGEFGQQRQGTTPVGSNVRAMDPSTFRLRGASRPGLSKYLPVRVGGLTSVIQHLAVIVDPTVDALLDDFDSEDDDATEDPSTNNLRSRNLGRVVRGSGRTRPVLPRLSRPTAEKPKKPKKERRPNKRPGKGTGRQPSRNKQTTIAFVQARSVKFDSGTATGSLAFSANITAGNLIVICVGKEGTDPEDITCSDSQGNVFTTVTTGESGGQAAARMFYAIARTTGANTVSITWTGTRYANLCLLEYRGATALDASDIDCDAPTTTTWRVGPVSVNGAGELVIGMFTERFENTVLLTWTVGTGFNLRANLPNAVFPDDDTVTLQVVDKLRVGSASSPSVVCSVADLQFATAAIGASFRRGLPARRSVEEDIRNNNQEIRRLQQLPGITGSLRPAQAQYELVQRVLALIKKNKELQRQLEGLG